MLICCVPSCFTNSRRCHSSITFHEFPTNPDMHAKWIKNINTVIKDGGTWYPPESPHICSKHFLPSDFKRDCKYPAIKPRSVPTIFTNILGFTYKRKEFTHSPLIVKIAKNTEGEIVNDNSKNEKKVCKRPRNYNTEAMKSRLSNSIKNITVNSNLDLGSNNRKSCVMSESLLMPNCPEDISLVTSQYTDASPCLAIDSADSDRNISTDCALIEKSSPQLLKKTGAVIKKKPSELELIEIGPNTFLKINPEVIKVTKKVTPSGNHVLQFLMNQKSMSEKTLPRLITTNPPGEIHTSVKNSQSLKETSYNGMSGHVQHHKNTEHVLGHLVENQLHNSFDQPQDSDANCKVISSDPGNIDDVVICNSNENYYSETCLAASECIANAPVLLTTNVPVSHCFTDKQKLVVQLKQKSRLVNSLRAKISRLTKRLEDMENKCVVQERQLSYTNIKKLKIIKKNATKGDASAIYILEQMRAYSGRTKMHWSDSTLKQCGVWCKKAPYAYEYFKKAGLFKLPCLSTVKRFMKKNPHQEPDDKVLDAQGENNDSSSDFNFDDSDDDDDNSISALKDNIADCEMPQKLVCLDNPCTVSCNTSEGASERETIRTPNVAPESEVVIYESECNESSVTTSRDFSGENSEVRFNDTASGRTSEANFQDSTLLQRLNIHNKVGNVQEIILQNGEVVQCLNSKLANGHSMDNQPSDGQYYIIPTLEEPSILTDHQYSVVQSHGVPLIIQNVESNNLSLEQSEQLIFITQTSNQLDNSHVKEDS